MSLRNQPYLPLYVQDFLTDEKLMNCSASATGIYIRLMCIMHKSDEYGTVLLKQKDKQNGSNIKDFALKLARFMPYPVSEIEKGLAELLDENVIENDGDKLLQRRMVKDNDISNKRAIAGKKGGNKTKNFAQAKSEANSENENENENKDVIIEGGVGETKKTKQEDIKSKFINDVLSVPEFDNAMKEDFLRYWGEPNAKGKMRWQLEKTWDTKLRLITWQKRSEQYGNKQPSGKVGTTDAELAAIMLKHWG